VSRLESFPSLVFKRQGRFSFRKNGARGVIFAVTDRFPPQKLCPLDFGAISYVTQMRLVIDTGSLFKGCVERNCGAAHVIIASDWTSHKKREIYRDSVAMDSLRPMCLGTDCQSFELWDLRLDLLVLGLAARPLSSGTCSQTSKLWDLQSDLRARRLIARPSSSGTLLPDLRARGLIPRRPSSGTHS
jgi:hypothetical protein